MKMKCGICGEYFEYEPNPEEDIDDIKKDKNRIFVCGEC
jgi:hypothetical protein